MAVLGIGHQGGGQQALRAPRCRRRARPQRQPSATRTPAAPRSPMGGALQDGDGWRRGGRRGRRAACGAHARATCAHAQRSQCLRVHAARGALGRRDRRTLGEIGQIASTLDSRGPGAPWGYSLGPARRRRTRSRADRSTPLAPARFTRRRSGLAEGRLTERRLTERRLTERRLGGKRLGGRRLSGGQRLRGAASGGARGAVARHRASGECVARSSAR